jgi:hypothetical protein
LYSAGLTIAALAKIGSADIACANINEALGHSNLTLT